MFNLSYTETYLYVAFAVAMIIVNKYISSSGNTVMKQQRDNMLLPFAICVVLAFWLGFRPFSAEFGDSYQYALGFDGLEPYNVKFSWDGEWFWAWLQVFCKMLGMDHSGFFTVVYFFYVLSALFAVKIFMPNKTMLGMAFVWTSLMYFSFGVNGLRNGMACHMLLLGFALILKGQMWILPGVGFFLLAFGTHRSTMLPIAAFVVGRYIIRDAKYAVYFWLLSIPVSLVAGGAVTSFFSGLGFDDRMSGYSDVNNDMSAFSHTGFRWDFLFYSMWPVVMTWVNCVKRKCDDNWYRVLSVTYCLANAFWVMVIRASYSNRFAYLSWFLYPIIIAYPLVNIDTWEDQDRKTGYILMAYAGFTFLMDTVYW